MKFLDQREYEHIPYHTVTDGENGEQIINELNVKKAGCGLCCSAMAVDILTDRSPSLEEIVEIAESCGAGRGRGTNMKTLSSVVADKFGLEYSSTSDLGEAIRHLQAGGVIVAHMGVPVGAEIGLFAQIGHYILLISTDGEEFCILDPYYKPGKFDIPARAGKVNDKNAPYLYCNVSTLDAETKPDRIKYYMLKRRKTV